MAVHSWIGRDRTARYSRRKRLGGRQRGLGGRQRMPEKWSSRVCVQMRYLACYYQGQSWIPVNKGDGYFLQ